MLEINLLLVDHGLDTVILPTNEREELSKLTWKQILELMQELETQKQNLFSMMHEVGESLYELEEDEDSKGTGEEGSTNTWEDHVRDIMPE